MPDRSLAELDDGQLVDRHRTELADDAFDELWRRHAARILGLCRSVLRNEAAAEDITQTAFLRAFLRLNGYRPDNFGAWLWRIAHNLCINHLKSAAVRHEHPGIDSVEEGVAVNEPPPGHDLFEELISIIDALPDGQRRVLKLFYLDEYSYNEISELTGLTAKEVKSHIQNGRRMLKSKWERLNDAGK